MHRLLLISAALVLAACADPPEEPADLNYLHAAIVEPNCATIGCHSAATAISPPGDPPIDLSTPQGMCDKLSTATPALLRGEAGGDYPQMPPDVPLPSTDIELLTTWINGGQPGCE